GRSCRLLHSFTQEIEQGRMSVSNKTNDEAWAKSHQRRVAQFTPDVREAHKHSTNHRDEIAASVVCGCFCCCRTFSPSQVEEWIDEIDDRATTALCPFCGVDSV